LEYNPAMKLGWLFVVSLVLSGCVKSSTYDSLKKKRADENAAAVKKEKELSDKLATTEKSLATTKEEQAQLQKQYDNTTSMNVAMEERLKQLGTNVDSLNKEKAVNLARLEELRRQKALAEERAAVFRNLVAKLRGMIDSGQLKVVIRDGRMIIALPNDILFDSGSTAVKKAGKEAIGKVAKILANVDRRFLVVGHTDNVPIKTAQFASNWELSTARAVEVVQILIKEGMNPKSLSAAGYSEFDPVVANDTPEHKAQNRRIEIVLQPNLADLPPLDDVK
jgi:chemotaxis protein MotB